MADVVEQWRAEQERRGLEPGTVRRRTDDLRAFERYIAPIDILDATRQDVNDWLDSRPRPISAKTRYNLLSGLHTFYSWAIFEEITDHDPTARITRPKLRRSLPRPMPENDLKVALAAADTQMFAWLVLGALEGARCMEIAQLERGDVLEHLEEPIVLLRGKGSKERIVPLHDLTWLALQNAGLPRSGRVFLNRRGRPYSPAAVSALGNAFLHGLGIDATMHQLRHRFGTELYRLSKDLRLVQELMGHASPNTTAGYAAYDPTEAAHAVSRLTLARDRHPSGKALPLDNAC